MLCLTFSAPDCLNPGTHLTFKFKIRSIRKTIVLFVPSTPEKIETIVKNDATTY
jgi:hypothetical protein